MPKIEQPKVRLHRGAPNSVVPVMPDQVAILESRIARLERQLTSQQAVTQIIAQSTPLDTVLIQVLQTICEHIGWDLGEVWNIDASTNSLVYATNWQSEVSKFPEFSNASKQITFAPRIGLPGRVWDSAQAHWIPDVVEDTNFPRAPFAAREGLHGGVGLPIRANGKVIGVMCFFSRMARPSDTDILQVLDNFGAQIGLFAERQRVAEIEHQRVQSQIAAEERLRAASELHRAGSQAMFSAAITAELLPYLWDRDLNKIWYGLDELRQLTRTSLKQFHSVLSRLGAETLAEVDAGELLDMVIKKLTADTHLEVDLTVNGQCPLPTDVQMGLYCIVQEAVQNIIHHARATRITISLHAYPDAAELRISDNGRGFDPNVVLPDRLGLRIMRESAQRFRAELDIASKLNHGTQITLRWNNSLAVSRPLLRAAK